jgi:hypothetical protein
MESKTLKFLVWFFGAVAVFNLICALWPGMPMFFRVASIALAVLWGFVSRDFYRCLRRKGAV